MSKEAKVGYKKNIGTILLLSFDGSIIYGLPYFRYDYYDAYLEVYNLTNTQMGVFGSIFGVFGMISYLFGGYLADRFSIRMLLTLSVEYWPIKSKRKNCLFFR